MPMSTTAMRCPCPPPQQHRRRTAAPAPALELLDEYWFFSNTLANTKPTPSCGSPSKDHRERTSDSEEFDVASAGRRRLLLRTPSLPPPRPCVDHQQPAAANLVQQEEEEVDDDDLNWSSIYEGVLRTRMAEARHSGPPPLRRAPSMPVPSSASDKPSRMSRTPSSSSGSAAAAGDDQRRRRSNNSKNWRSSSASNLEVQAFREVRSAAEMKDQLRMWAQAVACNVRQDCT